MARRLSPFLVRFLAIGVLAHAYVGVRLLPDLAWPAWALVATASYLIASVVLIPQGMLRRATQAHGTNDIRAWIGLLAMGAFSSLFVLTVLRDLVLLGAWAAQVMGWEVALTTWRRVTAWAVVVGAALATLVGLVNARRLARVVDVSVPIAGLPAAWQGLSIVQISDIHVGPTIKRAYVQRIVDRVNALAPDVIVITGDLVDGSVAALAAHVAPLAQLHARRGVYVVTGNHEYYSDAPAWVAHLRTLGLTVLMNEHVVLDAMPDAAVPLVLGGVTDYNAGQHVASHASDPAQAMAGAPAHAALRILLAHQPRSAPAAAAAGFDLQLSGHTHGGQFLPWGWFVTLQQPYVAGLRRHGAMWVYISRGTGYWGPPKRLGAPSEITRLRLSAAPGVPSGAVSPACSR